MLGILETAKRLTSEVLRDGSIAIDATLGNGHDAVHLVERVAPTGHVYGIDVQPEALRNSRERLKGAGSWGLVTLLPGDHADLTEMIPAIHHGMVDAVMFNLGYLPGGDRGVTTRPESTIPALEAATAMLRPGGRLTAVMYRGHSGGDAESRAVMEWAAGLDQRRLQVLHYHFVNQMNQPPELLAVEKIRDVDS